MPNMPASEYASRNAVQPVPRMQTQLQEAASRQENLLTTHNDLLNSLRERLEPIMRPAGPEVTTGHPDKEKGPASSALTMQMHSFASHVQAMNGTLEDILRRLEI